MQIKQGDTVEGFVTGITKYGAFVNISDTAGTANITGMIHISEVSREYVNDISEHLEINQKIRAVVIGTNKDGRFALSIKRAEAAAEKSKPADFEDMLSKFKRDSDERIAGLNLEGKKPPRINKRNKTEK